MMGVDVPGGIYAHVAGIDVVRDEHGEYCVLEDNLCVPSGVSSMLENRKMTTRLFPELFASQSIRPIQHYPDVLLENLHAVAPAGRERPTVAVMTPGAVNSAHFEHAFLAQQMGGELVEGQEAADRRAVVAGAEGRARLDAQVHGGGRGQALVVRHRGNPSST